MTLDLNDPQYPEHDLGSLELSVTLSPKEGDTRDAVRNLFELRNQNTQSFLLSHTLSFSSIISFTLIYLDIYSHEL